MLSYFFKYCCYLLGTFDGHCLERCSRRSHRSLVRLPCWTRGDGIDCLRSVCCGCDSTPVTRRVRLNGELMPTHKFASSVIKTYIILVCKSVWSFPGTESCPFSPIWERWDALASIAVQLALNEVFASQKVPTFLVRFRFQSRHNGGSNTIVACGLFSGWC